MGRILDPVFGALPSVTVRASGDATGATDPANIQAAINAMLPTGGQVGLLGKFYLASGITIYPGIGLVGDSFLAASLNGGQPGTTLNAVAALNAPMITCQYNATYSARAWFHDIRDLVLIGTHAQTAQDGIYIDSSLGDVLDMHVVNVGVFDVGGNGLNAGDTQTKLWIHGCYFEHCQKNGIRSQAIMNCTKSYIFGNVLWGIDATSSAYLHLTDNQIWSNSGGGVLVWSVSSGALLSSNSFKLNGDGTHPTIQVTSMGSGSTHTFRTLIHGNNFAGTGTSTDTQYFIATTGGMDGNIAGNSFFGQKSGNKAISVAAHASNNVAIRNNQGFNAYGQVTNPLDTTNNRIGIAGTTATPVASTDYTIAEIDTYLIVSGGTGVSITIKDPAGNTVESGLTSYAKLLPIGFKVNFGAFTVAPTVTSYAN